jgi:hypothetical protein
MKYLISLLLCSFLISPSFAQSEKNAFALSPAETVGDYNKRKITAITEEDIRHFLKVQSNLHKGPYQDYVDFIKVRYADDIISDDTTTTIFENQPPSVKENKAFKQDLLNESQATYNLLQGGQINSNIDEIVISSDRKEATARDTTTYFNQISGNVRDAAKITIKVSSKCLNKFRISQDGILQMNESTCRTTTTVKQ